MDKRIDIYVTQKIDVQKQEKLESYLFMNIVPHSGPSACVHVCV